MRMVTLGKVWYGTDMYEYNIKRVVAVLINYSSHYYYSFLFFLILFSVI